MQLPEENRSPVTSLIGFCLQNKLIVLLVGFMLIVWGVLVAPFDWDVGKGTMKSVPVDAIPDIGENQQIVFTAWPGRSPQDIDDQISYPLTVALLDRNARGPCVWVRSRVFETQHGFKVQGRQSAWPVGAFFAFAGVAFAVAHDGLAHSAAAATCGTAVVAAP